MSDSAGQQRIEARREVYPTAIAWSEGCGASGAARLLESTGVIDPATAQRLAARHTPMILGRFDPEQSSKLVTAICNAGGDAFAPSMADIAALGPTLKIRDMRIANGNLDVDIWRGLSTTIRREHVQFLVRGSIKSKMKADRAKRVAERASDHVMRVTQFAPRYGTAMRYSAEQSIRRMHDEAARSGLKVTEVLDIHTRSGTVFQVDGDKFAFSVLGDMKGHSDNVNMDQLCELIAHISPDEVVDAYFSLFRAPVGYHRLFNFVRGMSRTGEDPAFAFYSRWAALMYRHVMHV